MTRASITTSLVLAILLAFAGVASAQEQNDRRGDRGNRGDRGADRGERRQFDPEQFRERMMNRYKEQLGIQDDEDWKVILPKLEKVMAVQRDARSGGGAFGGFGGRGGPGGGRFGGERQQSPVARAAQELRSALENESTSPEVIGQRLTAYREARAKAQQDLAAAQKELRELLVQRQEAVLVMQGLLD
jgi:hypothetical protein